MEVTGQRRQTSIDERRVESRRLDLVDPQADAIESSPGRRALRRIVDVVVDPGIAPRVDVADGEDELLVRARRRERLDQYPRETRGLHLEPQQAITSAQDSRRGGILNLALQIARRQGEPYVLVGMMGASIPLEEACHRVRPRLGKAAAAEIETAGPQPIKRAVSTVDESLRLRAGKKSTVRGGSAHTGARAGPPPRAGQVERDRVRPPSCTRSPASRLHSATQVDLS